MTFEERLQRMLDRVPDSLDKREGSIIYNALAPSALELAQMDAEIEEAKKVVFPSKSTGDDLTIHASELGVVRHPEQHAVRLGLFYDSQGDPMDVDIGERFSLEILNYEAIEKIDIGRFRLKCETPGAAGNQEFGALIPIENIPGLGRAELADVLVPGEEEESDAALLKRYLLKTQEPITSGNPNHYKMWALEVPGVGDARVTPVWDVPGTVKVALITSEKRAVDQSIVDDVYDHIESLRPVGALVTVVPATEIPINISATLELASWATIEEVKIMIEDEVTKYLKTIAFADPDKPPYIEPLVRYTRIANLVLDVPPIIDYSSLLINGVSSNIEIMGDQVAVLGVVDLWQI